MLQQSFVFDNFIENLLKKPYCSDDLSQGVLIRPKLTAIKYKYIQPNSPYYLHYIVLDLDYEAVIAEIFYNLLIPVLPNVLTENPENGKAHLILSLKRRFIQLMQAILNLSSTPMRLLSDYSNFLMLM